MVIDTSALMAVLLQEPEADLFAQIMAAAPVRIISAASVVEATIVAVNRGKENAADEIDMFLGQTSIEVVSVTPEHVNAARDGIMQFGKGRNRAGLNFGDCFSYALAKATNLPLLYKGTDFCQTVVRSPIAR